MTLNWKGKWCHSNKGVSLSARGADPGRFHLNGFRSVNRRSVIDLSSRQISVKALTLASLVRELKNCRAARATVRLTTTLGVAASRLVLEQGRFAALMVAQLDPPVVADVRRPLAGCA